MRLPFLTPPRHSRSQIASSQPTFGTRSIEKMSPGTSAPAEDSVLTPECRGALSVLLGGPPDAAAVLQADPRALHQALAGIADVSAVIAELLAERAPPVGVASWRDGDADGSNTRCRARRLCCWGVVTPKCGLSSWGTVVMRVAGAACGVDSADSNLSAGLRAGRQAAGRRGVGGRDHRGVGRGGLGQDPRGHGCRPGRRRAWSVPYILCCGCCY